MAKKQILYIIFITKSDRIDNLFTRQKYKNLIDYIRIIYHVETGENIYYWIRFRRDSDVDQEIILPSFINTHSFLMNIGKIREKILKIDIEKFM